jgi:ferritin-like metal-binding protein YciE
MGTQVIDLFGHELRALYGAERQRVGVLNKMAAAASDEELSEFFRRQVEATTQAVGRLEQAFAEAGLPWEAEAGQAMRCLVEEAEQTIVHRGDRRVLDLAIIATARRMEHLQMACYRTACNLADHLQMHSAHERLRVTLDDTFAADRELERLCSALLNGQMADSISNKGDS